MSFKNKGIIQSNKPCNEDLFEGKPHDRLANIISTDIKSDDDNTLHIIGIDGEWGSGKSNLIEIIKKKLEPKVDTNEETNEKNEKDEENKEENEEENEEVNEGQEEKKDKKEDKHEYLFFTYDAWKHQTDLPRRTFLEELTTELVTSKKILKGEKWKNNLQILLAKKKRTNTITVPAIGIGIIASLFSLLILPIITNLAGLTYRVWLKFIILFVPYLLIYLWAFCKTNQLIKKQEEDYNEQSGFAKTLSNFFLIYKDKIKEDTTYETISDIEPTSNDFEKWFCDINKELNNVNTFLIIVIDNMDRLPKDKVRELWAVILSIFSEKVYSHIRIIVPFDRIQLRNAFQIEDICQENDNNDRNTIKYADVFINKDINAINYADDFINKTFSIVYCVPPPIMTCWMQYFQQKWEEAFGKDAALDKSVLQIYDMLTIVHTPRKIISFINRFVTIKNICDPKIEDKYIALYILGRNKIMKDPLKEILSPTYLDKLSYLYKDDYRMSESISALHYQLPVEEAKDIVYTEKITRELNENDIDFDTLEKLKRSSRYWPILYRSISNVAYIENVTLALNEILKDDQSPDASNIWEALYKRIEDGVTDNTEYKEYHSILLAHIKDKERYYKILLVDYNNHIQKDKFDVLNYIRGVDKMQEILCEKDDDFMSKFQTEIAPWSYHTLILERHERFAKYGLVVNPNEFDDYLSKLSDKAIESEKIYPYTKDIINTPKYINKVKTLFKNKFSINPEGELMMERIKEIETRPFNIISYCDIAKLTILAKKVHPDDKLFPDMLAIAIPVWDIQGGANYRAALQKYFNLKDEDLVKHVAKVIEYYVDYGTLLLKLPKYKSCKLFVEVARDLTSNKYGVSRMDVKQVLSKYDEIVTELGMPGEKLLNRISDWDITGLELNDIEKFSTRLLDDLLEGKNKLSRHCIGLITKHLNSISQNDWCKILMGAQNNFSFKLLKLLHPVQLPLCYDAFKYLMTGYAKGELDKPMPKENVDEFIRMYGEGNQNLILIFTEIRDIFINNSTMTKDKLKYMGNWLMRYGQLWENDKSLEKIFQSQYLVEGDVVQILINHPDTTKRIYEISSNSDAFRNKMSALLASTYKTDDAFKELCALLGIE